MTSERFATISDDELRQRLGGFVDQARRLGYREAGPKPSLFFRDYGCVVFFLDFREVDEEYGDTPKFYWQFKEGEKGTPWRGTVVRQRMVLIEAVRVRTFGVVLDVTGARQEAELVPLSVQSSEDEEEWHYRHETDDWDHGSTV